MSKRFENWLRKTNHHGTRRGKSGYEKVKLHGFYREPKKPSPVNVIVKDGKPVEPGRGG